MPGRCAGSASGLGADGGDQRRQQGGAGSDAREVQPLVVGMVVPANGSQAVQGREPERSGRVRVARAAGRGVAQREAELRGNGLGLRHELCGGRRQLHGRVAGQLPDLRLDAVHAGSRDDGIHRRPSGVEVRGGGGPQVDVEAARRGHDVGAGAAGDDARVQRDGGPAAVQRVERFHHAGCGEDGVAPLLRLDARVGRAAVKVDAEVRNTLARAHDVAIGARALQDQDGRMSRCQASDVRGRERRSDLLVGVGDERDRGPSTDGQQRSHGQEPREQTALHVTGPRSGGSVAVAPEGPPRRGARVEDGVHVADEEDPGSYSVQAAHDEVTELTLVDIRLMGDPLDRGAEAAQRIGDVVGDEVHALGGVRAAVDGDQRLELREVAFQPVRDPGTELDKVDWAGIGGHGRVSILPAMPSRPRSAPGVELAELRVLDGPNRFFVRPAVKLEFVGEAPGLADAVAREAARQVADLHVSLGLPAPRSTFRSSTDQRRAVVAFVWRRRALAQATAAAAARLALGRSTRRRELAQLRTLAPGPLPSVPVPRIPVVAVTGTNGKSTTTRLIAHVLAASGRVVGMTNSDGIYLRGELVEAGDWTGYGGAGRVLAEPGVEVAVLETARGGILLRGIGYDRNDVAVVTNVSADHLGLQGIDTLDELAEVKAAVVRVTRRGGWAVLNADDPRVWRMRRETKATRYPFSLDPASPAIDAALAAGGRAAVLEKGWIVLRRAGAAARRLVRVAELPVTFGGLSRHDVANALAAAAAADALGLRASVIRDALRSFAPDAAANPGRMNLFERNGVLALVDFAHNEAGLAGMLDVCRSLARGGRSDDDRGGTGRVRLALGTAGDRSDEILRSLGELAGRGADDVVICEKRHYLRGRDLEEMNELFRAGLRRAGYRRAAPSFSTELAALQALLRRSRRGDVAAVMSHVERGEIFDWLARRAFRPVGVDRLRALTSA